MAGEEGTALRALLASFTIEVDRAGALARGHTQVTALKTNLLSLDVAAKKAAASVSKALALATTGGGGGRMLPPGSGALALAGASSGPAAGFLNGIPKLSSMFGQAVAPTNRWRDALTRIQTSLNTPRWGVISGLFTMENALKGFAAQYAIGALKGFVDQIGGIGEEASKLGVTNAEFQRMQVLAAQNATSVGALSTAFRTLASAAVEPTEESAEAFNTLGVELKNADGTFKARQDLFYETAGALADVEDGTLRAALAQKIYGRSSRDLAPLLAGGRAGLEAQRAELEKLPVLSDDVIAAADKFSDRWEFVKVQLLALAGPVLEKVVIPAMQFLLDTVSTLADFFAKLTKNMSLATVGTVAFIVGISPLIQQLRALVALGGGWGKVLTNMTKGAGSALKAYGPLIAYFLILEDIFTFFTGGDSLTGSLLDVFGDGTGAGVQKTIVDLTDAFKDLWKWVLGDGAGEKAKRLFSEIAEGIELLIHDALVTVGVRSGETGIAGLNKFKAGRDATAQARGELSARLPQYTVGPMGEMLPIPGTAGLGAGANGGGTTVQDNSTKSVVVQVQTNASPAQIGKAVSTALDGGTNRLISGYP